MNTRIAVIIGTGRENRRSVHIAQYVAEELKKRPEPTEVHLVDPREYLTSPFTIPPWKQDEYVEKWRSLANLVDAFVLVVPEYNHSFPGELKLLLDSALKEYEGKPVGLVVVSKGDYAGVRVLEHLFSLVATLKMYALPYTVLVGNLNPEDTVEGGEVVVVENVQQATGKMIEELYTFINK